VFGPDVIKEAEEQVQLIRNHLKAAQSRQKSCADPKRRPVTFNVGDFVSWEFRDSSHGEAYQRGSTLVTMGPARDCANRDTSVYPDSGPSRLEVNPYFLPASY
jgi:hypothetical protein